MQKGGISLPTIHATVTSQHLLAIMAPTPILSLPRACSAWSSTVLCPLHNSFPQQFLGGEEPPSGGVVIGFGFLGYEYGWEWVASGQRLKGRMAGDSSERTSCLSSLSSVSQPLTCLWPWVMCCASKTHPSCLQSQPRCSS